MELAANHLSFCEHYLKCRNAFQAAGLSGINVSEQLQPGYYVYLLIEKETGRIFYIGKGKGRRAAAHFKSSMWDNVFKGYEIQDIIDRGNTPAFVIFAHDLREHQALQIERELINLLAPTGLTNEIKGCSSLMERELIKSRRLLESIIPYPIWLKIEPRSRASRANYRFIVKELTEILSNGRA